MNSIIEWFGAQFPALMLTGIILALCIWMVARENRRITEGKEPSETDEWR